MPYTEKSRPPIYQCIYSIHMLICTFSSILGLILCYVFWHSSVLSPSVNESNHTALAISLSMKKVLWKPTYLINHVKNMLAFHLWLAYMYHVIIFEITGLGTYTFHFSHHHQSQNHLSGWQGNETLKMGQMHLNPNHQTQVSLTYHMFSLLCFQILPFISLSINSW